MRFHYYLLLLAPIAILGEIFHWSAGLTFLTGAIAVIPLAGLIGEATEALAARTGPKIGGLLNATLGNAAELIITIVAIRAGLLELVKASITGSIIGNLLLVLGLGMVYGGLRHGAQRFNRDHAGLNATLLIMAVIALSVPSLFSHAIGPEGSPQVEGLSLGVAAMMILLYGLGLLYSFRAAGDQGMFEHGVEAVAGAVAASNAHWSARKSLVVLALATGGVVWLSEVIVGAVEPVVAQYGLTEFFLGVVLIPIIGNVAEHLVAVQEAGKNQMDLSIEIAVGSSLQIALFVAPLLVFLSLALGNPLQLIFNRFELLALLASVVIAGVVSFDGESNWLEGAMLLVVYSILALAFFYLPA